MRTNLGNLCRVRQFSGQHGVMYLTCEEQFWRMRQIFAVGRNVCERTRDIFAVCDNIHDNSANNEGIRQPCSEWCPWGRGKNDACGKKRPNASIIWRTVGQDFHLNGWKLPHPVIQCVNAPYYCRTRQKLQNHPQKTQLKCPRPAKTRSFPANFCRIHPKLMPRPAKFGQKA